MPIKSTDNENISVTMQDKKMYQPKKSGIYMDREEGKLPQDRVSKYYQENNPKMEQDAIQNLKNVGEGFKFGAKSFAGGISDLGSAVYNAGKSAASTVSNSPVGKAIGATIDYLDGTKKKEADEHQRKYNEKRKNIMSKKS